jgi:CheY-like chemotaxis protein
MLGNFLSNAVKYTEQGGVKMTVRSRGIFERPGPGARPDEARVSGVGAEPAGAPRGPRHCALEFVVSDTGPGVPPAQIDRLFSLFTRVDAGNVFRREGTGVGLALVRRLCTLMGGKVWAANRPGGGAEFTLRLDLRVAERKEMPTVADPVRPAALVSGRRVLVVEDNPNARSWLEDALKLLGFSVQAVGDGETALAAVARGGIDLVMLDINLPGLGGMAVAARLRASEPGLRIVGCSAEAFAATREAALAAGMNAYLTKPISLAELEQAVGQPAAPRDDLYARLQSGDTTRAARARLGEDWPRMRHQTETALASGDREALRRLGHYLKSTALLIGDDQLGELCQLLSRFPPRENPEDDRRLLGEVDQFLARWFTAKA